MLRERVLAVAHVTTVVLDTGLTLVLLLVFVTAPHVPAAPSGVEGSDADPDIQAITLTASLPVSDTQPLDGISKAVYFNNSASGVLTLTFRITGTPPFTLTTGAAFHEPARTLSSSTKPWTPSLTHSVQAEDESYAGVSYVVANAMGAQSTATITYARDITSPIVAVHAPPVWKGLSPIPVGWEAVDAQSGVARTHLFYRRLPTDTAWQDAGLQQTGESGTFRFTPGDYLTYAFAAQATDNVSNVNPLPVTGTQVIINPVQLYLPSTMRHWVWWYRYDIYEPNDTPAEAWGPLVTGEGYEAYIWNATDEDDYYHITPSNATEAQIALSNIPLDCDLDLYVYYYDGQYRQVAYSNQAGHTDESLAFTPVADRKYYVRVFPYSGSSHEPYRLTATYE
jgi:hypothetical protein